jgi:acetyltransferase-like isoleucine patch superfamily enzyme
MTPERRSIRQWKNIVIWVFNILYNWMPFFVLKNAFLRATGVNIGSGSVIHTPVRFLGMQRVSIGENSVINFGCHLDNRVGIRIGSNVSIANSTKIYSLGHDVDDAFFAAKGKEVTIGDYACVFSNVLIMPGVKLGKGCVVYAGSVVTKDIGEYEVVGGNPARFIRHRSRDLRYKLEYDYWFAV